MARKLQRGYVYEASGFFFVRYCTTEIVDGQPQRVQRSHRLCEKDGRTYKDKTSRSVRLLRDEFMLKINQQDSQHSSHAFQQDMRVADFWEQRYLPYCEEVIKLTGEPRKKASTIRGYKQVWEQHLKAHFGNLTLRQYEPYRGTQFLQSLTGSQGKNTLKHVKALGGSIFKRAVIEQRIKVNPWHDVEMPEDAIEPERTQHYTLEEAEDIISALVEHVDCQLVLALSCFLALRPGEIAALKWEDFDSDCVHIRRSVVRGVVGTPKTPESIADIPLVNPRVLIPLELWRQKSGNPAQGWVFPSRNSTPVDLHNVVARVIVPHVSGKKICVRCKTVTKPSKLQWKGLYAGRRGACTLTIERTNGNYAVAQALLRHKSMKTTLDVYKKQITPEAFRAGLLTAASTEGEK
jgi:integrase